MKRASLLLLLVLSVSGCEQYARLVDGDGPRNRMDPVAASDPHGAWRGTVLINAVNEPFNLYLNETNNVITSGLISIKPSPNLDFFAYTVTGTVTGSSVSAMITEETYCPNKFTLTGTISGGTMTGTLVGDGNAIGSCHPDPINGPFTVTKL